MSSVLIRGMEMPKNCQGCPCFQYNMFDDDIDGYCKRLKAKIIDSNERHSNCPLIEISPHGRLGDLDELEKQFKRAVETYLPKDPTRHMSIVEASRCRGWTQGLTAVQEAKTVIEAED